MKYMLAVEWTAREKIVANSWTLSTSSDWRRTWAPRYWWHCCKTDAVTNRGCYLSLKSPVKPKWKVITESAIHTRSDNGPYETCINIHSPNITEKMEFGQPQVVYIDRNPTDSDEWVGMLCMIICIQMVHMYKNIDWRLNTVFWNVRSHRWKEESLPLVHWDLWQLSWSTVTVDCY